MNASQAVIPKVSEDYELLLMHDLIDECRAFLLKWHYYSPYESGATADAMVAISTLEVVAVERRNYLLEKAHQEILPF